MRGKQDRLLRLAGTQAELARLLEIKAISAHHQLAQLAEASAGISSALDRLGLAGLALHAATMRRLTEISVAVKATEDEIAEVNRTLLKVRLRQEALARRAKYVRVTDERKAVESESLDVTLGMSRKATGKHGVLE